MLRIAALPLGSLPGKSRWAGFPNRLGQMDSTSSLLIIGGTTASGKSALALKIAQRFNGSIINADSAQLYKDLPILTARPDPTEEQRAPHHLYGLLEADQPIDAAKWLSSVGPVLQELDKSGGLAILVGGTGLYIHALLHGLAPVPSISEEVRAGVRALPLIEVRRQLELVDPDLARRLEPGDRQRLMRGLEVIRETGRSLVYWQSQPHIRLPIHRNIKGFAFVPPRQPLRGRIRARFEKMLENGTVEEVEKLLVQSPDPLSLPIAKVLGLREIIALIEGEMSEEAAIERVSIRTAQYAKRQSTWFRLKLSELELVEAFADQDCERTIDAAAAELGLKA